MNAREQLRRAVGYLRVSTPGQAKDGTSLATQREAIQTLADSQGLEIIDWFEDAGISGTTVEKRPEMVRLLKTVQSGGVEVVVAFDLKRFTRDYHDGGRDALDEITRHAEFWTVIEAFRAGEHDSAADVFTRDIFGAVGAFEAREIREKMVRGRKARVMQGGWIGGPPPFGFNLETRGTNKSRNSILVHDASDVKTVRLIFELVVTKGWSFRDTYRHLSVMGVETPSRSVARKRSLPDLPGQSDTWNFTLRDFVERHVDIWSGSRTLRYQGDEFTITVDPILTTTEAKKLKAASLTQKRQRPSKASHPLSGRITGLCGRKTTPVVTGFGTLIFNCRKDLSFTEDGTQRAKKACGCSGVLGAELTEAVFELVSETITDPLWLTAVLAERTGSDQVHVAELEKAVNVLEADIEVEAASIAETVSELRKQGVSAATIAVAVQEMDGSLEEKRFELDKAERRLRRARKDQTVTEDLRASVEQTAAMLESSDDSVRLQIANILDLRVVVVDQIVCEMCSGKRRISQELTEQLNVREDYRLRYGATCPTCHGIGSLPGWSVYGQLPLVSDIADALGESEKVPFKIAA